MEYLSPRLIVIVTLFLTAVGVAGGMIPIYCRYSEKGFHRLLAFGTGMLLGTVFLHMLPEALTETGSPIMVLIGLLGVFVVEKLVFGSADHGSSHEVIGATAFFGLSVHAITVGLGLSAQLMDPSVRMLLIISLMIHKLSETFSLSTVFQLAKYDRNKSLRLIILFSIMTPLSLLVGFFILRTLSEPLTRAASGLAAGTFLYVALVDLLPEVFHHPRGRWVSFISLLAGIAIIVLILTVLPHH